MANPMVKMPSKEPFLLRRFGRTTLEMSFRPPILCHSLSHSHRKRELENRHLSEPRERELKADRHYPASKTHAESKRPLRTRVSGSAGYRCHRATRGVGASMPDGSSATPATPTLVKMPPPPRRSPIFCALSAPITNLHPRRSPSEAGQKHNDYPGSSWRD